MAFSLKCQSEVVKILQRRDRQMLLEMRSQTLSFLFSFLNPGRNLTLFCIYNCIQSLPNALSYAESTFMMKFKYSQRDKRCSYLNGGFNSEETDHALLTVESYQC